MVRRGAVAGAIANDCPEGISSGGQSRSSSADNNLVFSPLSIYSAFSLAAVGAKGRTLRKLLDILGAKSRESLAENVCCMVKRALPDVGS
ncbi:unnamed protein product [Miscanthus lutarioriparius]|uniref:Serpin domain-containing protein n=1 Tax=Miscanthus lutarioriparius TaxID=422564 RepID=A0A811NPP6_9POAL|nr:unnamed protein product [Miscanthus lutarioriparius]